jgi:transcriptional regulator with XRE-family HTH domain
MPDASPTHIGERLRDVRKRRGLTQRELAAASGVSLSLIRKLEQGEVTDTRLETAGRLAVALRVPTTRLLNRDAEATRPTQGDGWERVRRALSAPPPKRALDEPPTVSGVEGALATAHQLRASDAINELATVLPSLIRDADALSGNPAARPVRAGVLHLTEGSWRSACGGKCRWGLLASTQALGAGQLVDLPDMASHACEVGRHPRGTPSVRASASVTGGRGGAGSRRAPATTHPCV